MNDQEHRALIESLREKGRALVAKGAKSELVVRWRESEEEQLCIASDLERMALELESAKLAAKANPKRQATVDFLTAKIEELSGRRAELLDWIKAASPELGLA